MLRSIAVSICLLASVQHAIAQDLSKVSLAITEMCRGGTDNGDYEHYSLSGSAEAKAVLIKGLLEGGVDGQVELKSGEWSGIQAVIPDDFSHDTHVKCVIAVTPMLLEIEKDRYTPVEEQTESENNATAKGPCSIAAAGSSGNNEVNCAPQD